MNKPRHWRGWLVVIALAIAGAVMGGFWPQIRKAVKRALKGVEDVAETISEIKNS